MKKEYLIRLMRNQPIDYHGLNIHPVSFERIHDEIGEENFYHLLLPFRLTPDCLEDSNSAEQNIFTNTILKEGNLLYLLNECLKLFCPEEDFSLSGITDDSYAIVRSEDDIFHITSDHFEQIGEIILAMAGMEKIKVEKPKPGLGKRQLDIWNKIQEGRNREKRKNEITAADQLNICEFGGKFHIPMETLMTWSPWNIKRCFHNIIAKNEYDDSICLYHPMVGDTSGFTKGRHWIEKFKIRN